MLNMIACGACLLKKTCSHDLKAKNVLCKDFEFRCPEILDNGKRCFRRLVPMSRNWELDGRLVKGEYSCPKCGSRFSIHSQPKKGGRQ